MKTLLIMRHAKSSWDDPYLSDHDRPLNKRGKRDAPRMGQLLREEGLIPDLIISSTATRARKTAKHVARTCNVERPIRFSPELYQGGIDHYMQTLADCDDAYETILTVGHNPDLTEWLEKLTGQLFTFPTAAIAHLHLDLDVWSQITFSTRGTPINLWRPKELQDASLTD